MTDQFQEAHAELARPDAGVIDVGGQPHNRSDLLSLLRLDIQDERWTRAMGALRDSMRPIGTKEYVRFYRRANLKAKWEAVSIDVAAA